MRPLRILAIDDEEALLSLLKRFLTQRGHAVETYSRAPEALASCQMQPEAYDVAIADMEMPEMRGEALLVGLLEASPKLKVLVCSGYPFDTASVAAPLRARVGFLQKPFMPQMLDESIAGLIGE